MDFGLQNLCNLVSPTEEIQPKIKPKKNPRIDKNKKNFDMKKIPNSKPKSIMAIGENHGLRHGVHKKMVDRNRNWIKKIEHQKKHLKNGPASGWRRYFCIGSDLTKR